MRYFKSNLSCSFLSCLSCSTHPDTCGQAPQQWLLLPLDCTLPCMDMRCTVPQATCLAAAAYVCNHCMRTLTMSCMLGPHQFLSWLAGSLTRLDMSMGVQQHLQDGQLQTIAKLQSLSRLEISGLGDQLTDRGLLALTALTSLSFLHLADITSADVSLEVLPTRGRKGVRTAPGDALLLQTKFGKVRAHCNTDGSGLKCPACWDWRLHCCLHILFGQADGWCDACRCSGSGVALSTVCSVPVKPRERLQTPAACKFTTVLWRL
jgi:hypothetical protein